MSDINNNNEEEEYISFPGSKEEDGEKYRGGHAGPTMVTNLDAIGFFTPGPIGKGASGASQVTSMNSFELGGVGMNVKQPNHEIVVVDPKSDGGNADVKVLVAEPEQLKAPVDVIAPVYDHFQPMLAHFSKTKTPANMKESVEKTLQLLVEEGILDFYKESEFVYVGRAYGKYGDCEYRISIFSDPDCSSVTEIRRNSGEAFTFADAERKILACLRKDGALPSMGSSILDEEEDDGLKEIDEDLSEFTFGMLPDYESLDLSTEDLPTYTYSYEEDNSVDDVFSGINLANDNSGMLDDVNDGPLHISGLTEPEVVNSVTTEAMEQKLEVEDYVKSATLKESAEINLERAVNGNTVQSEWRRDVVNLKTEIMENPKTYKNLDGIVSKLVGAVDEKNYDAFVTRTILQSIRCLIGVNVQLPDNFLAQIQSVNQRWKDVVENKISDNLSFCFAPSQQVVKECETILGLVN